jgi:deoxycytidylate deaminase
MSASAVFERSYEINSDIDYYYLSIAYDVSRSAYIDIFDNIVRAGCIIVKDDTMISSGYNSLEDHAEKMAIDKCKWKYIDMKDSTLYTNLQPCPECTELIIESKIKKVVYSSLYPRSKYDKDIDLDKLLCKNGIESIFIPIFFISGKIDICKNLEMMN